MTKSYYLGVFSKKIILFLIRLSFLYINRTDIFCFKQHNQTELINLNHLSKPILRLTKPNIFFYILFQPTQFTEINEPNLLSL